MGRSFRPGAGQLLILEQETRRSDVRGAQGSLTACARRRGFFRGPCVTSRSSDTLEPAALWFSEQQEEQRRRLALRRPRRDRPDICQHGADLALDDLWRNAVSASIGWNAGGDLRIGPRRKVNHDEPAARLQRSGEASDQRLRLGEVVVRVTNQNGVATERRQIRRAHRGLDHRHVAQPLALSHVAQRRDLRGSDIRRVHAPGGPSSRASRIVQAPKPAPTSATVMPGFSAEQLDELRDFDFRGLNPASVSAVCCAASERADEERDNERCDDELSSDYAIITLRGCCELSSRNVFFRRAPRPSAAPCRWHPSRVRRACARLASLRPSGR